MTKPAWQPHGSHDDSSAGRGAGRGGAGAAGRGAGRGFAGRGVGGRGAGRGGQHAADGGYKQAQAHGAKAGKAQYGYNAAQHKAQAGGTAGRAQQYTAAKQKCVSADNNRARG